jgi:hypothetical protein
MCNTSPDGIPKLPKPLNHRSQDRQSFSRETIDKANHVCRRFSVTIKTNKVRSGQHSARVPHAPAVCKNNAFLLSSYQLDHAIRLLSSSVCAAHRLGLQTSMLSSTHLYAHTIFWTHVDNHRPRKDDIHRDHELTLTHRSPQSTLLSVRSSSLIKRCNYRRTYCTRESNRSNLSRTEGTRGLASELGKPSGMETAEQHYRGA